MVASPKPNGVAGSPNTTMRERRRKNLEVVTTRSLDFWDSEWTSDATPESAHGELKAISSNVERLWKVTQQEVAQRKKFMDHHKVVCTIRKRVAEEIERHTKSIGEQLQYCNTNGINTFPDGTTYSGPLLNGLFDGEAVYSKTDSTGVSEYHGIWAVGKRNGKGRQTDSGKSIYEGIWNSNEFHGHGTYHDHSMGSTQSGSWQRGEMSGTGILSYKIAKYEGSILRDVLNGAGTLTYSNGDTYTGEWVNNKMHGEGKISYRGSQPHYYSGHWVDGHRDGRGVYHSPEFTYDGDWKGGVMEGTGTYTYSNGDSYHGEWKNDHEEGQGKYTFCNGGFYDGAWLSGNREGHGVYHFDAAGQEVYEGEWSAGMKHGKGSYRFPSGAEYSGEWKGDSPHGHGLYRYRGGNIYFVEMEYGEITSRVLHHSHQPTGESDSLLSGPQGESVVSARVEDARKAVGDVSELTSGFSLSKSYMECQVAKLAPVAVQRAIMEMEVMDYPETPMSLRRTHGIPLLRTPKVVDDKQESEPCSPRGAGKKKRRMRTTVQAVIVEDERDEKYSRQGAQIPHVENDAQLRWKSVCNLVKFTYRMIRSREGSAEIRIGDVPHSMFDSSPPQPLGRDTESSFFSESISSRKKRTSYVVEEESPVHRLLHQDATRSKGSANKRLYFN